MKRTTIIIIWKIIRCVTLIFGVSVLTFVLLKQSPVDPVMASVNYDTSLTPAQYKAIAHHYGLDKPALVQYFIWLKNVIQGHLGTSLVYRQPVSDIIRSRAGASFILMGLSWILSGLIGFILGTLSAFHQGKLLDRVIRWFSYLQISVPTFWIGLIFLLIFSVQLGWFPIGISSPIGTLSQDITLADRIKHLMLPVFTLSILGIANVTLHTRTKMMSVLSSEYVLFARARGETQWQIFKHHCLRNAIVPAITLHFPILESCLEDLFLLSKFSHILA